MQQTNLTFTNNQNWILVLDMSQWALLYDLASAIFRMQARTSPTDDPIVYAWSTLGAAGGQGTIALVPGTTLLILVAPYTDMKQIAAGAYVYDLSMEIDDPTSGTQILLKDLATGTLTVIAGVTRI